MQTQLIDAVVNILKWAVPLAGAVVGLVELPKAALGYFYTKEPKAKAQHADHALWLAVGIGIAVAFPLYIGPLRSAIGV